MTPALVALTLAAALGSALVAGVFYAFSTFVMRALARLPPAQGIAAMQSINVVVINPAFLGLFLGTSASCLALAGVALAGWTTRPGLLLGGALAYLVLTLGVTMACNVPRNATLARLDPESPDAATTWRRYVAEWTLWNHVRSAGGIVAALLFALALR